MQSCPCSERYRKQRSACKASCGVAVLSSHMSHMSVLKVMIVDNFNWLYNMIDNLIISHLSLVDRFTRSFSHSTVETRIAQAATALRQVSFLQISSSLVVAKPWTKSGPDHRPESSTFRCTMSASYVVRVKHSKTKSVPKCPDECC